MEQEVEQLQNEHFPSRFEGSRSDPHPPPLASFFTLLRAEGRLATLWGQATSTLSKGRVLRPRKEQTAQAAPRATTQTPDWLRLILLTLPQHQATAHPFLRTTDTVLPEMPVLGLHRKPEPLLFNKALFY